ncbi:hypothetical protein JYK14_12630 [Siccirubricoccus sp. KC 17139]|uniref:Uncharacterized protein n=1 Tax=Siccirubricoccus soli TaxID=2899147 RepID=A0ABT1D7P1_9PROT|nr:hypothetical protein [Siccirubricoccus soli]MCO6417000.1 hypothetical protein [Siccirubricoccus soli]MCP2683135.1 hypothetical protein [Siccirubricoccus soli]
MTHPTLPDPRSFDPVTFPGAVGLGEWPPPRFDFAAAVLREPGLRFERDAAGAIAVVRRFDHIRLVMDIERAHLMFEIQPGSRDFLLLRLVPAALRHVETVAPQDPVPPTLRGEDPPLPEEHHIYAATTALVEAMAATAQEEAVALCDSIRRVPPGADMFEQAVARCITRDGLPLETVAPLARRLQRLANAHAGALAAAAAQPDYRAMERMVSLTHKVLGDDRRWANDLLTLALGSLGPVIDRPRRTMEQVVREADASLRRPGALQNLSRLITKQRSLRDRLTDLTLFWGRTATAWLAVHPETTDRREIEALARNTLRRLSIHSLYQPPE